MILRAMLPVGPPTPDRSRVMTQTKRDTWSSKLGVWRGVNNPTYLLTPWSRVRLEKLTVNFAASQEIPHIYGTRKFLAVPTSAWVIFTIRFFYGEGLLAPRPNPKLEDHPSSAVRGCLFNLSTPHSKKLIVTKVEQRNSWTDLMMMDGKGLGIYFGNCKESSSS
jgi:hypothetical protein